MDDGGIMMGLEGLKESRRRRGIRARGEVMLEKGGEEACIVVQEGRETMTDGGPGGMEGGKEMEEDKVEDKVTVNEEDGRESARGMTE